MQSRVSVPIRTAYEPYTDFVYPYLVNPAWNDFTNFVHRPNAPFKEEFERLSCIKGWDRRTKRQNLVALLRTEVEFYWSSENVNTLEYYQYLCQEMGIEHVPSTVTQARKVSILYLSS
jgi:hypothetical protein